MAGLCWVTVVLTFLLSPGISATAVDKDDLKKIVNFMMNRYNIKTQVGVAVNIPKDQDLNTLQEVFEKADVVRKKLDNNSVYVDACRMVAARPYKNVHAEVRVLKNMENLVNNANDHFLVFYSFYSPCGRHCMNENGPYSIIPKINEVFPNWNQFAFVFSEVFDKTSKGDPIDKNETEEALKQLGRSKVGHDNIFRCYKPKNKDFQCINCFNDKEPVAQCVGNVD
ncbi:uncharacterized protein LOC111232967 [Seriola dumerili]|uniref:uncharacterized protein LOC111232967 n=1 Tax=Seriola dumerili TaxID=41447 RepID=UPI000BBEA5B1|nr:uncharacterized protein LOC111232967 [Seriola dumerili]